MNFYQLHAPKKPLSHLKAIAGTRQFTDKVYCAKKNIENMMKLCANPILSCGGGKDSTAIAILAKTVNPDIYVICANPPNPLPDRAKHNDELKKYLGGVWIDLDYAWDVDAVLKGDIKYPKNHKIDTLKAFQSDNDIDGVIFGIRKTESNGRLMNYKLNGDLYKTKDGWRATPIVNFTAEESLAVAILHDAPINPVYEKTHLAPNYEYLRDGTWWCHNTQYADVTGGWMRYHYPELYQRYMMSVDIQGGIKNPICAY